MNISLTVAQQDKVEQHLASGRYADVGELIGSALEALEERLADESPELEAALLEGARDEHVPYGRDVLDRVRRGKPVA